MRELGYSFAEMGKTRDEFSHPYHAPGHFEDSVAVKISICRYETTVSPTNSQDALQPAGGRNGQWGFKGCLLQ